MHVSWSALAHFGAVSGSNPNATDPWSVLLQYGPLGLLVLGFVAGWIVPGFIVKQKDAEIQRLQHLFENETMPMMKTYATTLAQVADTLERALKALDRASNRDGG